MCASDLIPYFKIHFHNYSFVQKTRRRPSQAHMLRFFLDLATIFVLLFVRVIICEFGSESLPKPSLYMGVTSFSLYCWFRIYFNLATHRRIRNWNITGLLNCFPYCKLHARALLLLLWTFVVWVVIKYFAWLWQCLPATEADQLVLRQTNLVKRCGSFNVCIFNCVFVGSNLCFVRFAYVLVC